MIPQRNISLISNTMMSAGGRRIPEAVIERDYVLAWFLTGLAGHPLREVLAFKGGTALRRCWFEDYRFSEDLDFTLTRPITLEDILAGLDEIFAAVEAACGLRISFDREDRHSHQNSHTFYLRYQGPLPAANDVKVDITITEVLCFPLQDRPIHRIYNSFDDLPEGPTVKVYAIKEIVVEKLLALHSGPVIVALVDGDGERCLTAGQESVDTGFGSFHASSPNCSTVENLRDES